jgi:uncharacterized membrane protein (UPF0136 family)
MKKSGPALNRLLAGVILSAFLAGRTSADVIHEGTGLQWGMFIVFLIALALLVFVLVREIRSQTQGPGA